MCLCYCCSVVCSEKFRVSKGFFFYKQKTAYEMRSSDWSSDVWSSDLRQQTLLRWHAPPDWLPDMSLSGSDSLRRQRLGEEIGEDAQAQIGRASCRERVCQYV